MDDGPGASGTEGHAGPHAGPPATSPVGRRPSTVGGADRVRTAAAVVLAAVLVATAVVAAFAVTGRIALPGHCPPADAGCLRVLFVGNSYTYENDLPGAVADLVRAGGRPVEVGTAAVGGATLAGHAQDPATAAALAARPWSAVVLQDQSEVSAAEPTRSTTFLPGVRAMAGQVMAIGARPLLFETWAHRDGSPGQGLRDHVEMQAAIDDAYEAAAGSVMSGVAPVGAAWAAALAADPGLALWQADGSHPSPAGTYLAACVIYAALTGRSPVGLPARDGVDAVVAAELQRVADSVVLGARARWRIPVAP